jgi:hypothetical protein
VTGSRPTSATRSGWRGWSPRAICGWCGSRARSRSRLSPSVGGKLAVRQRGHDPALIDHAWRVQRRLNARWNLLRNARGKPAGIVTIAIARELVGACWEIATAR